MNDDNGGGSSSGRGSVRCNGAIAHTNSWQTRSMERFFCSPASCGE